MPNPWTGKGNPYIRQEVRGRLKNTIVLKNTTAHGFVGASSLERMGVEQSLTDLTWDFKKIGLKKQ